MMKREILKPSLATAGLVDFNIPQYVFWGILKVIFSVIVRVCWCANGEKQIPVVSDGENYILPTNLLSRVTWHKLRETFEMFVFMVKRQWSMWLENAPVLRIASWITICRSEEDKTIWAAEQHNVLEIIEFKDNALAQTPTAYFVWMAVEF